MRSAVAAIVVVLAALLCAACGEQAPLAAPVPVLDDLGTGHWASVTVGRDHTCALDEDGRAWCWGSNASGQLGTARSDSTCGHTKTFDGLPCMVVPTPVDTPLRFRAISAGGEHTCALADDRTVWCWGSNANGELGAPSTTGGATPVRVASSATFSAVSAGNGHSCAIRTDGGVLCWGRNNRGQLAKADTSPSPVPIPVTISRTLEVSAGEGRTCARTLSNTVYCWGAVWIYRQNGLEYTVAQPNPAPVPAAPRMVGLSVGTFTTCGTDAAGLAYCWEANPHGEMGTGNTDGSTTPIPVEGGVRFAAVSAGIIQTCGLAVSGAAYCWGNDTFGQLGVSASLLDERCGGQILPCATIPVPVYGRQLFLSVVTGFGNHVCGVSTRHNIYCWGLGYWGQLGTGRSTGRASYPLLVRAPVG